MLPQRKSLSEANRLYHQAYKQSRQQSASTRWAALMSTNPTRVTGKWPMTVLGVVLGTFLLSSCASLAPVGNTPEAASKMPAYPSNYGVAVTERTISQRLLDRSIAHTASVNIKALDPALANDSRISIDSFYSEVLLSGEVPTEALKTQIAAIVRSMPDVRQVYDEMTVGPNRGYSSTVQDGYITSKVMAKVLANKEVKTSQVKVVTNNGVVFIMGRMTPTQQSHVIDIANQTVGITELVLLTTLVNDNGEVLTEQDVMQEQNLEAPTVNGLETVSPASTSNRRSVPINQATDATNATPNPSIQPAPNQGSDSSNGSGYIDLYQDQIAN
ncbi:BON domain-containing protein [Psychrobacter arenosus]|uniref:BON domain-containing protein n=1 Tax=Psychrobacter arenosus TaxID=256326 RepID=UPI001D10F13A|nr:BON domain-containing protein [Psychrobacter arenosus]